MTTNASFFDLVARYYGDPQAEFATDERLQAGQRVMVLLAERAQVTRATGRRERNQHVVWLRDERGRKYRCRVPSSQILINWSGK